MMPERSGLMTAIANCMSNKLQRGSRFCSLSSLRLLKFETIKVRVVVSLPNTTRDHYQTTHLFSQPQLISYFIPSLSISIIMAPAPKSGIAVGHNHGHKVTPKDVKPRLATRKAKVSKKTEFVRSLVNEVTGLAPYERRLIELIRNSQEKRAKKLSKKKLGTHVRAMRKFENMNNIIAELRRQGH